VLRTGLTGGIATGKSYCLQRFAALGAATIDADVLAREAVAQGSPGLRAVVESLRK
jgi:dephospho-CoA kinase